MGVGIYEAGVRLDPAAMSSKEPADAIEPVQHDAAALLRARGAGARCWFRAEFCASIHPCQNVDVYEHSAVALGDLKNAVLYFDEVVPVDLGIEWLLGQIAVETGRMDLDRFRAAFRDLMEHMLHILPQRFRGNAEFGEHLLRVNNAMYNVWAKKIIRRFDLSPCLPGVSNDEYQRIDDYAPEAYFQFIYKFGLAGWPLAAAEGPILNAAVDSEPGHSSALVTLSGLNLLSARDAPWEQVLELRRDAEARRRLRRLRLFAYENYAGKSKAFIEDDILSRIEDYELVTRRLGLERVQGALSVVANSKLTAGALAGTLVSAFLGEPLPVLIASGATIAFEVGRFALELRRQTLVSDEVARSSPVSFITYGKNLLADE